MSFNSWFNRGMTNFGVSYLENGILKSNSSNIKLSNIFGFGLVNVKDFGAVGNGTNDDTAAIQDAIDSLTSGGTVYFPVGSYKVTSTITIDTNGINLLGEGWKTIITRNTDFGDTFYVHGNNTTGALLNDVGIENLQILSTGLTTSGAHIHCEGVNRSSFNKIYMKDGFIGLLLNGVTASYINTIYVVFSNNYTGSSTGRRYIEFGNASDNYAHPHCGDLFITDFNIRGNTSNQNIVEYGCNIKSGDGIWFENGHIGNAQLANIHFDASTTHNLNLIFFTNVMTDEGNGYGVYFSGSTPSIYRHIKFSNCMFKGASTGTYGIATSNTCTAIYTQFDNCTIVEFKYHGIYLISTSTRSWLFNNCAVNGNALDTGSISAGYYFVAGIQDIVITGGSSGRNYTGVGTGLQYYGIQFAGGSTNVRVNGVDLTGNASQSVLGGATAFFNDCLIQDTSAIASSATLTPRAASDFFSVSGTTNITSIASSRRGRELTLIFQDTLTVVDGSNLILNGNFVTSTNSVLRLLYDGSNWIEISRSSN